MAPGARGRASADARPLGLSTWSALLRRAGSSADPADVRAAYTDLVVHWAQPHRHYHNLTHLSTMLDHVDRLGGSDAVRLAGWFHDAVCDPTRSDNESASATLASAMLSDLGVRQAMVEHVVHLVLMTRTHEPDRDDSDGQVISDADLAVLAAPPATYDAYADAIRREYSHLRNDAFRRGRSAFLRRMLRRRTVFTTANGREHWERPARANMARELSLLEDESTAS